MLFGPLTRTATTTAGALPGYMPGATVAPLPPRTASLSRRAVDRHAQGSAESAPGDSTTAVITHLHLRYLSPDPSTVMASH